MSARLLVSTSLIGLFGSGCQGDHGRPDRPDPSSTPDTETPTPGPLPPNFLIVLADDLGVDKVGAYGLGSNVPATPTFDRLAAEGLLFTHAWTHPVCSPARAALLSGRHPGRTGIGNAVQPQEDDFTLDAAGTTLPELLAAAPTPYASAALGKWHLGTWSGDDALDPQVQGFDHYAGSLANLRAGHAFDGQPQSYTDWEKTTDGVRARTTKYATTDTVDDALAAIDQMPEPWLAWVATNAAHSPYHTPPPSLYDGPVPSTLIEQFDAMVTAWDAELGRLVDSLDPEVRARTVILVIGDNGTPPEAVVPPMIPQRAKQSVYEGGVRVPMVVVGPGVVHGTTPALVAGVDHYRTLGALAGVDPTHPAWLAGEDSVDFGPVLASPDHPGVRDHVLTQRFAPNGFGPRLRDDSAVRDARYKLIRTLDGEHLYDLGEAWMESDDLLLEPLNAEAQTAYDQLAALLDAAP